MSVRGRKGSSIVLIELKMQEKQQTIGWYEHFHDDFNDGIIDPVDWTQFLGNGTITEEGETITLAFDAGVNAEFFLGNAPVIMMTPGKNEIMATTKINSYTVNDDTRAGLYITDQVLLQHGIYFSRYRNDSFFKNGLQVRDVGFAELAYVGVTTLPIWLRIHATNSGAGSVMDFDYSTDGINWTNLHTQNNETWIMVGLLAANWGAVYNACSAPFEFFEIDAYGPYHKTITKRYAPIDVRVG